MIQSCQKLARAKTKYTLLCDYPDEDIFSSVRPKIGKVFSTDGFEERKKELLKSCRHNIIELGKEEALEILERAKLDHSRIVGELQSLPPAQYRDLLNFSYRYEKKLLEQFTSKHQRKIEYHWRKKNIPGEVVNPLLHLCRQSPRRRRNTASYSRSVGRNVTKNGGQ